MFSPGGSDELCPGWCETGGRDGGKEIQKRKETLWCSKGQRVRGTKEESWVWLEPKVLRLRGGGRVRPAPLCFLCQSAINLHFVDGFFQTSQSNLESNLYLRQMVILFSL